MAAFQHLGWNETASMTSNPATETGEGRVLLPSTRDTARATAQTIADMIEPRKDQGRSDQLAVDPSLGLGIEAQSIPIWDGFASGVGIQTLDYQNGFAVDSINPACDVDLAGNNYDLALYNNPSTLMTGYTDFMPLSLDMPTASPANDVMLSLPYNFQPIAPAFEPRHDVSDRQCVTSARIRCTANGCTKTFRRPGDYRRHMKKHQDPTFNCVVRGCHMEFYRLDKLRDHLRKGHKVNL